MSRHAFIHGFLFLIAPLLFQCSSHGIRADRSPDWYPVTAESKPWTRWWWHGNGVTKEGITAELEAFQKAGIGGVEITPIYGVYGQEDKFIQYLSPEWMDMLQHVLAESERLGLGVDMATGTGWPFGGPWVTDEDACKTFRYKTYSLNAGQRLTEKITCVQEPYLRVVTNQRYEVHDVPRGEASAAQGTRKEPVLVTNSKKTGIEDLKYPITANPDLQALAIDQVQFERPLELVLLMAYAKGRQPIDITLKVNENHELDWIPPDGEWTLYAIFEAWHGKMVERAGPGGEGNVIDHFSSQALDRYLSRFDSAMSGFDVHSLRAFFNDSYEVDDARGAADFTPFLFDEFIKRRGYDLRDHIPAWLDTTDDNYTQRIRGDYRETISELVLENFTQRWKAWARRHGAVVRNQAHGSPANILDLYAVVDIPEIEGNDPLRFKMASSSGNVTGKKLVSAEALTWLDEHFKTKLSDVKHAMDNFMLNGINHLVYHGTAYSPKDEPWPGWLFYAAVHVNQRNPFWNDLDAVNKYVARCQSFLQNTTADHDVLLYYPIHDRFAAHSEEMIEHFDGIGRQFTGTSFASVADTLLKSGYTFDFISDRQIKNLTTKNNKLLTEGNGIYKTLVVPECKYIPLATLQQLEKLASEGTVIIFMNRIPQHVTGYLNHEKNENERKAVVQRITAQPGHDKIILANDINAALKIADVERESVADQQLDFYRKKNSEGNAVYFIRNRGRDPFEGWIKLTKSLSHAVIYDPMTGSIGQARMRHSNDGHEIFVQMTSGQTVFVECHEREPSAPPYRYYVEADESVELKGPWTVTFNSGGPALPASFQSDSLIAWTSLPGKEYQSFSGTATYKFKFNRPAETSKRWKLKFEHVHESADVFLNGELLGTMIGPAYEVEFDDLLVTTDNILEIKVSNSMANRIAWLDRQGVVWKKFYNINFPARRPENVKNNLFDASGWVPEASGLTGTATLVPLK